MKYSALFIFIIFFLHACKKDDANTDVNTSPQPSKTELITDKPWKYISWTANPPVPDTAGMLVSDILNYKPPCERDDILIFATNGIITFDQGPAKCDASDPQTDISTWDFASNETKITLHGSMQYNLVELTSTTMKWTFDDVQGSTTHRHTIVFEH